MTPAQRDRVSKELRAVLAASVALAKAEARIKELEAAQAEREAQKAVDRQVADAMKAVEAAKTPHEKIAAALAAARAGNGLR
ncbi:MAG: hypothetical protein ACYDAN_01900 [Candidatus Limnocylindrales bacterium]